MILATSKNLLEGKKKKRVERCFCLEGSQRLSFTLLSSLARCWEARAASPLRRCGWSLSHRDRLPAQPPLAAACPENLLNAPKSCAVPLQVPPESSLLTGYRHKIDGADGGLSKVHPCAPVRLELPVRLSVFCLPGWVCL